MNASLHRRLRQEKMLSDRNKIFSRMIFSFFFKVLNLLFQRTIILTHLLEKNREGEIHKKFNTILFSPFIEKYGKKHKLIYYS